MKILVGPEVCFAGSHFTLTRLAGAATFRTGPDLLAAVEAEKPDIVFLRAVSMNNVTPQMIRDCPVPVVGFYHDWTCWGSERLEAVADQVDWLVTEKTAFQYLAKRGVTNCSPFLLMSHNGVENVKKSGKTAAGNKDFDVSFLGAMIIGGYKDLLRFRPDDPVADCNNTYWTRLGFRGRSRDLAALMDMDLSSLIVAAKPDYLGAGRITTATSPSYDIVARSAINVHLCHGRRYAANRCFETLALGTFLLCEKGNELLDFVPEGVIGEFEAGRLPDAVEHYLTNAAEREEMAAAARAYAAENLTTPKLQEKLLALVDKKLPEIKKQFETRFEKALRQTRAPVHHETLWSETYDLYEKQIEVAVDSALGDNESGWFQYEKWLKLQKQIGNSEKSLFLNKAATLFASSIEKSPLNLIPYWNRAVALHQAGDTAAAADILLAGKKLIAEQPEDVRFCGSRLELRRDWWASGHIEPAMAFRKLREDNNTCERSGFLYRADMLLHFMGQENKEVHWPDLPDEYAKTGDWHKVSELDPFWQDEPRYRDKIYDLNRSNEK